MADILPGNGQFLLYPNIPPMLLAGSYTLTAEQSVTASGKTSDQLPVDDMDVHIEVRSPRLVLPPDQVLSTFPPAESEGPYGTRLPQVVIRRRTLPWERKVEGAPVAAMPPAPALPKMVVPWLALVVVAEGEATLVPNVPAASAITPGVTLKGAIDADVANCLEIRQSMVKKIFPTQKDVPLLAHARLVDIGDTELMMGDDDGFLAVVVANRLPVGASDADGDVAVHYTACLVNIEGQWGELLPSAPTPKLTTPFVDRATRVVMTAATMDKHVMGAETPLAGTLVTSPSGRTRAVAKTSRLLPDVQRDSASVTQTKGQAGFSTSIVKTGIQRGEVTGALSTEMLDRGVVVAIDRLLRFPVLLHWRFTTKGGKDFQGLMQDLDSGLLGTKGKEEPKETGRLPLELVDTGHVGLEQKNRRGDSVRAWYRGPFVPHPTEDDDANRLPLAHAADQLRIVIPDGREDLSLASAFEIGRLLALANPNMVAALLRWRQLHYVTVRRTAIWQENAALLGAIDGFVLNKRITPGAAIDLSRAVMRSVSTSPTEFLGPPRPLVEAGRKLPIAGDPAVVLSEAFGLPELRGTKAAVLTTMQKTSVRVATAATRVTLEATSLDATVLTKTLDKTLDRLVTETTTIGTRPVIGPVGRARPARKRPASFDALDEVIERLTRAGLTEPEE